MLKIYIVIFCLFGIFYIFNKLTEKYKNDKPIRYFIGLRGSGKTTLATKLAVQHLKVGHNIYSNFELYGAYKINPDYFGKYTFPPNSAIFLDEVSLIWSNRNFSTFKKEVEEYFRLSRKYKVYIYMFSQSFDVDKKIRDIVDEIYIIKKIFNVFSIAKKIDRSIVLHNSKNPDEKGNATSNNENFLSEDYKYSSIFQWEFTFIPRWIKYFNSFEAPFLPIYKSEKYLFNDYIELYKTLNRSYYVKTLFNDFVRIVKHKIHIHKYGFYAKFEDYMKLNFLEIL